MNTPAQDAALAIIAQGGQRHAAGLNPEEVAHDLLVLLSRMMVNLYRFTPDEVAELCRDAAQEEADAVRKQP